MKNYKKLIAGVFVAIALLIGTSGFSAETAKTGTVVQTTAVQSTSLYNAKELGLSLATGYVVDPSAAFQKNYSLNLIAGASYFPTRYLGFEANVPLYQSAGVSINEVQAGALIRVPLSKTVPVLKNFAPYIGLGGVYNWQSQADLAYIVKGGTEFRLTSKWSLFAEAQARANNVTFNNSWVPEKESTSLVGGLKVIF